MANTAPSLNRWRIGFDIGGTFTDFILYDAAAGTVRLHKRLTTPHDPSEAALLGLEELVAMGGITLAEARERLHEAKKLIANGKSPAREKARERERDKASKTFDDWAQACGTINYEIVTRLGSRVPRVAVRHPGASTFSGA